MRALANYLKSPLLFCFLLVPVLFVICNPFFEMGVNDDWQYVGLARALAETGRIQIDGWTRAIALPQMIWGALAIKIAGFSFVAVRASMIPIVLGCCALTYAIARWLELSPWLAALTVSEMLLCPLFLPLATTFMSDVPSLLFVLMTLYCVLRGVEAPPQSAGKWIAVAAVVGFLGGANRQVMWVAPVVMIAGLIAVRRRERHVVSTALIATASVILAAGFAQLWFSRRGILGVPATWLPPAQLARRGVETTLRAVLTLTMFCLPALLLAFGSRVAWTRRTLLACSGATALLAAIAVLKSNWSRAPWLGNTVTVFGMLRPGQAIAGVQPVALSRVAAHGLGVAVIAMTIFGAFASPAIWRALRERGSADNRLRIFAAVAIPFGAVYFVGSLFSAFWPAWYFDRYLLPVIAILNLGAMAVAARLPGTALRLAAVPVLLIFGLFGLAMTHDAFRQYEARARAGDRLRGIGVPRTCVSGGYEYDGWTELATRGRIGRDAYEVFKVLSAPATNTAKQFWFLPVTPSVRPRYFVVASPQPGLNRTLFTQPYRAWLPPTRREVLVQTDSPTGCD
jgi:hypothetical protein